MSLSSSLWLLEWNKLRSTFDIYIWYTFSDYGTFWRKVGFFVRNHGIDCTTWSFLSVFMIQKVQVEEFPITTLFPPLAKSTNFEGTEQWGSEISSPQLCSCLGGARPLSTLSTSKSTRNRCLGAWIEASAGVLSVPGAAPTKGTKCWSWAQELQNEPCGCPQEQQLRSCCLQPKMQVFRLACRVCVRQINVEKNVTYRLLVDVTFSLWMFQSKTKTAFSNWTQ